MLSITFELFWSVQCSVDLITGFAEDSEEVQEIINYILE